MPLGNILQVWKTCRIQSRGYNSRLLRIPTVIFKKDRFLVLMVAKVSLKLCGKCLPKSQKPDKTT